MSWQKRNGKGEYYYSATRYGSRVVNLYMGGGTVAAAAFTLERADRERRQEKHRQQKQERKRADEQDRRIADFCRDVEELRRAALMAAGFHRHDRGQWRKRRAATMAKAAENPAASKGPFAKVPTAQLDPGDPGQRHELLYRAEHGDAATLPAVRQLIAEGVAPRVDLAQNLEKHMVEMICRDNLLGAEAIRDALSRMRRDLAGGVEPSPLERLLIERIVACWLALQYHELLYTATLAASKGGITLAQDANWQSRIDKAQRRFESAIRSLAQVRRLQIPAIMLNVAQNQVNVGAQQMNAGNRQINAGGAQ